MKTRLYAVVLAVAVAAIAIRPAAAFNPLPVGPRAMGMGNALVAAVDNTEAAYYNPAAFGFFGLRSESGQAVATDNNNLARKDWGLTGDFSAGVQILGEFGEYVDSLAGINLDELSSSFDSEEDAKALIKLMEGLSGIEEPGNALVTSAVGGAGARIGRFGIGARGFFAGTGYVSEIDTENLGVKFDLDVAIADPNVASDFDGEYGFFTDKQVARLTDTNLAGLNEVTIQKLDYLARNHGVSPELAADIAKLLEAVATTSDDSDTGLEQNQTAVTLRGFQLVEFPVSYGHPVSESFAVGANVKMMRGRVYGNHLRVFDSSTDEIEDSITDHYQDSTAFGLDVGALARTKRFNFGIVARNVNSPTFDGFTSPTDTTVTISDVTLKPQVTIGAAFIPTETLTFAADYDLTENETVAEDHTTQNLNLGMEWDAFRFLALRGGATKNLAEDDSPWIYSAGLGVNLWAMRLDVAGAISNENTIVDGDEVPAETRFSAQISIDF